MWPCKIFLWISDMAIYVCGRGDSSIAPRVAISLGREPPSKMSVFYIGIGFTIVVRAGCNKSKLTARADADGNCHPSS
jgi:hypothetical protein